jgi:hypothetical protein
MLVTLPGCGKTTCEDVCNDKIDQCPEDAAGCAADCRDVDTFNELSGCEGEYSDLAKCRQEDVCGEPSCDAELSAWKQCRDGFCATDPNNPLCTTAAGG